MYHFHRTVVLNESNIEKYEIIKYDGLKYYMNLEYRLKVYPKGIYTYRSLLEETLKNFREYNVAVNRGLIEQQLEIEYKVRKWIINNWQPIILEIDKNYIIEVAKKERLDYNDFSFNLVAGEGGWIARYKNGEDFKYDPEVAV